MGIKGSTFDSLRIRRSAIVIASALAFACALETAAMAAELVPQTKFRVKVVQWIPVKSAYEEWTALGGQFTVSNNGNIALPVVGQISAKGMDTEAFADEVANRLQKKTGLVNKPEVSIEIVEYPPVYVTGNVMTPGEYKYREGMTVMQAVALGGGPKRLADEETTVKLLSDLRTQSDTILLETARIARLQAEINGEDQVTFPDVAQLDASGEASGVFERERILFEARVEELNRQTKSLQELRDLFEAEIKVLEQKRAANDEAVQRAEKELQGVSTLVDKGFAIAARKSEMERVVTSMKSDSLDQTTAIMRARQGAAEATRNLEGLTDRRRSEAAADLQTAKSNLDQSRAKRDMAQRLLLQSMMPMSGTGDNSLSTVAYSIIRNVDGSAKTLDATEITALLPGDVLNVTQEMTSQANAQSKSGDTKKTNSQKSVSQ